MTKRRVVITGLGTLNPLGNDVATTWQMAVNGCSGIDRIRAFDPSELKTQIAGEVKGFDAEALFGRKEARRMDRVTQLAVAAAGQAIEDAGLTIDESNRQRVGVVLGCGIGGFGSVIENAQTFLERGPGRVSPFFIPMMLADSAPGQIAISYGARGPNMSIVTACASSNNALGEAGRMVARGDIDVVISGGTEAVVLPLCIAGFNVMGALSTRNEEPQRASRPFDRDRDGFVPSEGAAILILESLDHAQARGAKIYGELLGYGTSADAYHIAAPLENGGGAIQAMRGAMADAGVKPEEIGYINAHGTSTALNDASETRAVKAVFGERAYEIPISSTKSMHGHLMGASGALEALISLCAMAEGTVPPTINYETPSPECDLDYVPNVARRHPFKVFMSNGFGFGGHNATIVIGSV